jgi:rare lipoprotein A
MKTAGALVLAALMLAGCAETQFLVSTAKRVGSPDAASSQGGYKVGNPYQIKGVWYYPAVDYDYDETGIASWYGPGFHGKKTANGEIYDQNALTAAHRTLPMPSRVRVTNLENGRSLVLTVNDRGPFAHGRIIDLSRRSAQLLDVIQKGTAKVRVTILADESRALAARYQNAANLADTGSPITVDKLPKASVAASDLPPPGQGDAATPPIEPATAPLETAAVEAPAPPPAAEEAVQVVPVGETNIYVQAGAFGVYENANAVRARLSSLGSVQMTQAVVNGADFYRVRLGPFASVDAADRHLETVIASGFPDARIIVD